LLLRFIRCWPIYKSFTFIKESRFPRFGVVAIPIVNYFRFL